ncbi:MAG: methyltransferase domain-containing protein [Bacteroidia bacterium]|nr:methyltransferase domain-containing protein [Bacteroidia bacterium]
MNKSLEDTFGNIDIYLFDQLLKGRFDQCKNVLDVGCGGGRNLIYFLRNGLEVFGIDQNEENIEAVKKLSQRFSQSNALNNFVVAKAEEIPFRDDVFDLVICNAVVHFAKDKDHFDAMLKSIWRVLKPNGFLFIRLASSIGIEDLVKPIGNGRYLLPDGSQRFLVDEKVLLDYTKELKGELFEPIKTTNVQSLRCMTTWCLRKKV